MFKIKYQYKFLLYFISQLLAFSTISNTTLANPVSLQQVKLFPEEYTQKEFYFDAWYYDVQKSEGRYVLNLIEGNTIVNPIYACSEYVMAFVVSKNLLDKLISLNLKGGTTYRVRIYANNTKIIEDAPFCEVSNSLKKYGYYSNVKRIQFLSKWNKVVHDIEDEIINNKPSSPVIKMPIDN